MSAVKVAVGSENPVKVNAVRECFSAFFKNVEVLPVRADSSVPSQPRNSETARGAINRAREAISKAGADYGVGIEGGLMELDGRKYFTGFCAIVDRLGNVSTDTSGWFECPAGIMADIDAGEELGDITMRLTGIKDIKTRQGAIGIWTRGAIDRKALYAHGLYMCLVPYLNRELYGLKKPLA
ncbi:MAG: inosine/xanthosine triphosphatase [Candidatus Aenigmarchaeota archaeon]|nr:inosine/xanthosine triphosphatase [Candidatus Aenigmarchaeota archaeon]